MFAIYVDDRGCSSKPREMTEEEMNKKNRWIDMMGLEEYGYWIPYRAGFERPEKG